MGENASGAYLIDDEYTLIGFNDVAGRLYPQLKKGEKCHKCLMGLDEPCQVCPVLNGIEGPRSYLDPIRNIYETVDAVEINLSNGKKGHALVFGTVGVGAQISGQLPNDERGLRLLGVISVLGDDFGNLFSIERDNGQISMYKYDSNAVGVEDVLEGKLTYEPAMKSYIENNVIAEDRPRLEFALTLDGLCSHLKASRHFCVHYRVKRDGELHYFCMKGARVGEADDFKTLVIGFANEDASSGLKGAELFSPRAEHARRKLLVIEDNETNRELLGELLSDEYDIIFADNGEMGLQRLAESYREISAILLDLYMPVCDGYEFLKRRAGDDILTNIPAIVMTGSDSQEEEAQCLELGAVDFIKKPYNADIVKARIRSVIRLRESTVTLAAVEYDELTGLYTRQAFFHHAKVLLHARRSERIHVVVGDIKNFKLVNSIYGDKTGDEILKYVADFFNTVSDRGLVARYGSDQFIAMIYGDFDFSSETMSEVSGRVESEAPVTNLIVNYGVYMDVDTSLPVAIICDRAFMAMKSIANDFESRAAFYDDEMGAKQIRERMMEHDFEPAIQNREFVVYFQPKYDVETETIVGAEALVRWKKPDGTLVPPGSFIPIFEKDGLIKKLDEYVFREVCSIQRRRMEEGEPMIPVSVNLSRATLHQDNTVEKYVDIVRENNLPFPCVPIELTETVALQSIQLKGLTEKMIAVGFPLHMDDFGTGYSSITSLNVLPFDVLKLDKSLIDFADQQRGRQVIKHVIALAHGLGMKVLSEGVESREQVDFLRENGCDEIQGYFFSKPQPYEVYAQMVRENYKKVSSAEAKPKTPIRYA